MNAELAGNLAAAAVATAKADYRRPDVYSSLRPLRVLGCFRQYGWRAVTWRLTVAR